MHLYYYCGMAQRYYVATYAVSTVWAMQYCQVAILCRDTTGTTFTVYEIDNRKKRKKNKNKRRQIEREKEGRNRIRNKLSSLPRRRCGKHLKITNGEKEIRATHNYL